MVDREEKDGRIIPNSLYIRGILRGVSDRNSFPSFSTSFHHSSMASAHIVKDFVYV